MVLENIMLSIRIKNMEYCFPQCWESILNLDYPKKNIDVYIIENDSTIDRTAKMVDNIQKKYKKKIRCFTVDHLEQGMKEFPYWDEHRNSDQFWKHANSFITLHNKWFYPEAERRGDKYFFSMAADNIIRSQTLNTYLQQFTRNCKLSWVSGLLNRRKSGDGKPAVYKVIGRTVEKPWRLGPFKATPGNTSATLFFPERVTEMPKTATLGLIGYGVTMQPTELCIKYPLNYSIGDCVLSYITQARADGYTEMFLPYIIHQHIDRNGVIT